MLLLMVVAAALVARASVPVLSPGSELYPTGVPEVSAPVLISLEMDFDAEGRATRCHVVSRPSVRKLDSAACLLAQSHMRLAPRSSSAELRIPVQVRWAPKQNGLEFDGAVPVSPESWLTTDDYPERALRLGRGGTVGIRFDVSPVGQ